uniref:Uncharacterized protein n=1 Tax=Sphaerodactylus townsendi TaxID=933632 RepID=A0ACB8EQA4_9SAUR
MNALLDLVNTTYFIHSSFVLSESGTYLNHCTQNLELQQVEHELGMEFDALPCSPSVQPSTLGYLLCMGPLLFHKIHMPKPISYMSHCMSLVLYCCIHFPVVNLSAPLLCNIFKVLNSSGIL